MASAVVAGMPEVADFAQRHFEAHAETRRNRGAVGFHLDYRYLAIAVGAPGHLEVPAVAVGASKPHLSRAIQFYGPVDGYCPSIFC